MHETCLIIIHDQESNRDLWISGRVHLLSIGIQITLYDIFVNVQRERLSGISVWDNVCNRMYAMCVSGQL